MRKGTKTFSGSMRLLLLDDRKCRSRKRQTKKFNGWKM